VSFEQLTQYDTGKPLQYVCISAEFGLICFPPERMPTNSESMIFCKRLEIGFLIGKVHRLRERIDIGRTSTECRKSNGVIVRKRN
jgi:hypothetical protein